MDQERFDELARKVFDTSSRRRLLGGAVAGIVGAATAKLSGVDAQGKGKKKVDAQGKGKKKVDAQGKKDKGRAHAESVCADSALGAGAGGCPIGTCCFPDANIADTCVTLATQQAFTNAQQPGPCGNVVNIAGETRRCRQCPDGTFCQTIDAAGRRRCVCNSLSCQPGCCQQVANQNFVCVRQNANGILQDNGQIYCVPPTPNTALVGQSTCNSVTFSGGINGCCNAAGQGRPGNTSTECGSGGRLCENCTLVTPNGQCVAQTCPAATTTTTTTTAAPTTTTTTTTTTSTTTTTTTTRKPMMMMMMMH